MSCNVDNCTCTYTSCSRRGKCCECIMFHREVEIGVPGCLFSKEGEKSYDRSTENFVNDYMKNNRH